MLPNARNRATVSILEKLREKGAPGQYSPMGTFEEDTMQSPDGSMAQARNPLQNLPRKKPRAPAPSDELDVSDGG